MAKHNKNGLTPQQQLFADTYLADPERNQRRAYKAAYPKKKTDKVVDIAASKLIGTNRVHTYIQKRLAKIMKPLQHTQENVVKGLKFISEVNIRDFFDEDGDALPPHKLSEACGKAVAGVKVTEDKNGKKIYDYKLVDKGGALRMLGQNLQMYVDVIHQDVTTHEAALDDLDDENA